MLGACFCTCMGMHCMQRLECMVCLLTEGLCDLALHVLACVRLGAWAARWLKLFWICCLLAVQPGNEPYPSCAQFLSACASLACLTLAVSLMGCLLVV